MKRFFIIILLVVTTAACGTRQVAATVARPIAAETVAPTQVADDFPAPTLVPTATPTPACAELKGRLVKETYPGAVTNKEIPVNIYLPACFDEAKSYPVLYLLHGQPADANFWVSEGVADAADSVNADLVIVMPLAPEPLFSHTDGGQGSYEQEFMEGLIPFVVSKYHVSMLEPEVTIAGVSRGGAWALEIGMRHPELFGKVVAISAAISKSVNLARPMYNPNELAFAGTTGARFLFIAGNEDWARFGTTELHETMTKLGFDTQLQLIPGSHEAKTWVPILPAILKFASGE